MAKLVRRAEPDGTHRCGWVRSGGVEWIESDPVAALEAGGPPVDGAEPEADGLVMPLDPTEVWGAGVTYERSRQARIEESRLDIVSTRQHAPSSSSRTRPAAAR